MTLPVGIVGGGISGLSLALALQKNGIHSVIFEKDSCFNARRQGYGLTLQQGGKSLKKLGLLKTVNEKCILSNCHYIFNHNGFLVIGWGSEKKKDCTWDSKYNCHISRQALRACLFDEIDPNFVKIYWDCEFRALRELKDGVELVVNNGTFKVSLVAACDGIHSSIRKYFFPSPLNFLKTFVLLGIFDTKRNPLLSGRVLQMSDGYSRIFLMPFDKDKYMWQLSFPCESQERITDATELHAMAKSKCREFHPPIPQIIEDTPHNLITGYPVFDRDPLCRIQLERVTFLGDAAHPMSPFKGQGANQALLDSISLADALSKYGVKEALEKYEAEMLQRTSGKVILSRKSISLLHCNEFLDTQYQLNRRGFQNREEILQLYHNLKNAGIGIWSIHEIDKAIIESNFI